MTRTNNTIAYRYRFFKTLNVDIFFIYRILKRKRRLAKTFAKRILFL